MFFYSPTKSRILFEAELISDLDFQTSLDVPRESETCKTNIFYAPNTNEHRQHRHVSRSISRTSSQYLIMLLLIPFVESITRTKPRFLPIILIISMYRIGGSNFKTE